jgi:predicted  nucleic acid-binding Zn-ribbon protein
MRSMVTRRTDMPSDLPNLLKAMSAEALHSNNQQFLTLATENLKQFQQQAEQKLTEKQTAIATMLQPVSETLQKMDGKIAEIEAKREGAYAELRSVVNAMKDQHVSCCTNKPRRWRRPCVPRPAAASGARCS